MATIYAEDWAAGNSLFSSMYNYQRPTDGVDPLYPYMRTAEGVHINGDGRLDADPAHIGPFETYQQAGIWIKGAGPLDGGGPGAYAGPGFWNGTVGCVECLYHPTTLSLTELDSAFETASLIHMPDPNAAFQVLGVEADLDDAFLRVVHANEGSHPNDVSVFGAPMPVAGQPYKVRLGWLCGTFDEGTNTAAADGYVRVWINDALAYEATNISLLLTHLTTPGNLIDGAFFGYFGLLGPQSYFTISDSACPAVSPLVFRSGVTEYPVAWMEHTLRA